MTLEACADIVRRGDPDRFRAAMAAPPAARGVLFPIYALNVEAARAPYVTTEPLIAEMRLQWWRDALAEIAAGETARRHEVATPLGALLDAEGCALLDGVVAARRWDVAGDRFEDADALLAHLDALAGGLMWAAARALGATDEAACRALGVAGGLAGWLAAVPAFVARDRAPLPDDGDAAIAALARRGLALVGPVSRLARPAALAAWEAVPVLRRAAAEPARVREGRLTRAPAVRQARLLRMALLG
ncbi:phytoene synthase [Palleronia sediminis]|uniref:Phytoene synthase n=1 Tax=Palleronia sediminis TaxID=2547833 RepID=A0A4R6AK22_9RHOB|nr:squalene/phytoene synthase family protein [Palleronia sediminis]TDL83715.1 phytoene synthase [Palleronia sediminis]